MTEIKKCKTIEEASQILEGNIPAIREYLEWVCKDVNEKFNKRNFSDGTFNLSDLYISLKTIEKRKWDKYEAQEQERRSLEIDGVDDDKKGRVYEQMDHDKLKEHDRDREIVLDADRALKKHKQMIILGNPGEGKTTLLYHYVHTMANDSLEKLEQHELPSNLDIPLFARLPQIGKDLPDKLEKDTNLIDVVMTVAEVPETLRTFIREQYGEGRVSLFLDALDEVSGEYLGPDGILQRYLSRDINGCSVVITSRIVGYPGSPLKTVVKELKLVPFAQKEIEQYIKMRFKEDMGKGSELLRQLRLNPSMRGLAQNPLLLGMMCKLFDVSGESLPSRRVELYEKCIDGLMVEWRKNRGTPSGGDTVTKGRMKQKKLRILEKIAYSFTLNETDNMSFTESFTIDEIIGLYKDDEEEEISSILGDIIDNDGLLICVGTEEEGRYMFLHLTFQEYFAARALSRKDEWLSMIERYFWKPRWKEIIKLLAGTLEAPMMLINRLQKEEDLLCRHLFLATECLSEIDDKILSEDAVAQNNELINKVYRLWYKRENKFIRTAAQEAVVSAGHGSSMLMDKLNEVLKETNYDVRSSAADALGEIGGEETVESLIEVLSDKDEYVRRLAVEALGSIGIEEAIEPLIIEMLSDKDEYVRSSAAQALGGIGSEKAIEPLIEMLKDEGVRDSAADALCSIGSEKAIAPLIEMLKDEDYYVRFSAKAQLGSIGSERAIESLFEALKDGNSAVRMCAAKALGSIGNEKATEPLIEVLKDEDAFVGSEVALALGNIGSEKAVELLIAVLMDKDIFMVVRSDAAEALGEIGSNKAIEPLIKALKDEEEDVRDSAVEALGGIGSEKAIEPLIEMLKNDDVRMSAAEALGKIGSEKAVEPLIKALKDEDKDVRDSAAEALGGIGSEKAIEPLIEMLKDEDEDKDVRISAVEALGKIGSEKSLALLIEVLKDEDRDYRVRISAAEALGDIGSEKAIEPLIEMLKNKDVSTAEALHLISSKHGKPVLATDKS